MQAYPPQRSRLHRAHGIQAPRPCVQIVALFLSMMAIFWLSTTQMSFPVGRVFGSFLKERKLNTTGVPDFEDPLLQLEIASAVENKTDNGRPEVARRKTGPQTHQYEDDSSTVLPEEVEESLEQHTHAIEGGVHDIEDPPPPRRSSNPLPRPGENNETVSLEETEGSAAEEKPVNAWRACPEGCHDHGTCNFKTGECACPPHLEGPNCSQLAVPACRSHADVPESGICFNAAPVFGWDRPVDCECHRQCIAKGLYVKPGSGIACYEQTAVPPESRTSRLPHEKDTTVEYYFADYLSATQEFRPLAPATRERVVTIGPRFMFRPFVPLENCPDMCNYRGCCLRDKRSGRASCHCDGWFGGPTCNVTRHGCIGNCSGHGVCKGSFCHCEKGHWGVSCQLSLEKQRSDDVQVDPFYAGLWPANVRTKVHSLIHEHNDSVITPEMEDAIERILSTGTPRIYIYELPAWINKVGIVEGYHFGTEEYHQYDAAYFFLDYLTKDATIRVADPEEADLFYVPFFNRMIDSNTGIPTAHVHFTLSYLQRTYPFWDRKGGRDHIWWFSEDWGACLAPREIRNSILIAHWGPMKLPVNESDPLFVYSKQQRKYAKNDYECYHPSKDVVAAGFIRNMEQYFDYVYSMDKKTRNWCYTPPNDPICKQHNFTFWFKGTISKGAARMDYSFGVRQKVNSVVSGLEGYSMASTLNSILGTRCSDFCLAPEGGGWGNRDLEAMGSGCVPVVVDTKVAKMFWDVLPWRDFAVILPYNDMDRLPQILDSYSKDDILAMKNVMAQHHKAVDWMHGGPFSAYGYTVHSLARRFLTNVILPDLGIINATLIV